MILKRNHSQQHVTGHSNQQAMGDIHNHYPSGYATQHRESAIEKVLSGLYEVTQSQELTFVPPDTDAYTFEDKIDHNNLAVYRRFFDQFAERYSVIQSRINAAAGSDPSFRNRLIHYVQGKFRTAVIAVCAGNRIPRESPDAILGHMSENVQRDLDRYAPSLTMEEIDAVEYVIFYVFAECKIFDKPPTIKK